MDFWKMNGAGNDFIVIDNTREHIPHGSIPCLVRILCERHMSIGADGVMLIEQTSDGLDADFRMLYYNSDGSPGEMCGNGARCIARYGYETGLSGRKQVIETTAGIVTGERITDDLYKIRLNDPTVLDIGITLKLDVSDNPGGLRDAVHENGSGLKQLECSCSYIELGDPGIPHITLIYGGDTAVYCKSLTLKGADEDSLRELGRALRYHSSFPKGANVNFVEITGRDEVLIRTYERGVEDFTYACGTGTGASAAALTLKGLLSGGGLTFNMRGGSLNIDIEEIDEYGKGCADIHGIMLTGPTNIVAKGVITDSALNQAAMQ